MKATFANLPQEKQARIINAALIEFGTYGYENASTNRLVKTLGISKGSLFKYFTNKLDLYQDLVHYASNLLMNHLNQFEPLNQSIIDNIVHYASLEYDFLINEPDVYRFFKKVITQLSHPDLITLAKDLVNTSMNYNNFLFNRIGLDEAPNNLRTHISIVIGGYNSLFWNSLDLNTDWAIHKKSYIEGLRVHLNLIKWR